MKKITLSLISLFSVLALTLHSQEIQTLELRPGPDDGIDAEVRTDMDWPIWLQDDFIANAWTVQGVPFVQRSLIKFNLSDLPPNSNIISAKLSLFCNTITGHHQLHAGENASELLRITEPWDQYEVTWNTQPSFTYSDSVILPKTNSQTQDYTDIDMTNMVRYFYNHPEENYGIIIKLIHELQLSCMVFSSSNHIDPEKRPLLIIEYTTCSTPTAHFEVLKVNNSNIVQFVPDTLSAADYWWDFGNGFYSDEISPLYMYPESGNYSVCLTVSDVCGNISYCDSIEICSEFIGGNFSYNSESSFVSFTPHLLTPKVKLFWDFGDGYFSDIQQPIHQYQESGEYQVCLYASNFCGQLIYCDSIYFSKEIESKSSDILSVYPNPTNGHISISHGGEEAKFESIKIVNFNGTEIITEGHSRLRKENDGYYCDFAGMETGIYIIHMVTDKGIFTQKAVVLAQ